MGLIFFCACFVLPIAFGGTPNRIEVTSETAFFGPPLHDEDGPINIRISSDVLATKFKITNDDQGCTLILLTKPRYFEKSQTKIKFDKDVGQNILDEIGEKIDPCINPHSNDKALSGTILTIGDEELKLYVSDTPDHNQAETRYLECSSKSGRTNEPDGGRFPYWTDFYAKYTYKYNLFGRKKPRNVNFNPGAYLRIGFPREKFCTVMSHRWAQLEKILDSHSIRAEDAIVKESQSSPPGHILAANKR
jgi:hypothetical protein